MPDVPRSTGEADHCKQAASRVWEHWQTQRQGIARRGGHRCRLYFDAPTSPIRGGRATAKRLAEFDSSACVQFKLLSLSTCPSLRMLR